MKIKNNRSNLYNVCTSDKITVKTLINKIFNISNVDKKIVSKGNTPGDQFGIYGNNKKIKKKLKIKKFVNIEEGLRKIIKF